MQLIHSVLHHELTPNRKLMRKLLLKILGLMVILTTTFTTYAQTNYYVSASNGNNLNDGLSNTTAKATIVAAVTSAVAGDIIHIAAGEYILTTTIALNKTLTIQGETGVQIKTSGSSYTFLVTATNVRLLDLNITKTDDNALQNIIGVQANNFELAGCTISGQYAMTGGNTSRALEISGGLTGLNIHDNKIHNLRQPGYINNNVTGNITNNLVYGTRGWVMLSDCNINFAGNQWGSGVTANYYDIAIINATVNKYTDIASISAANNDAIIENQHSSYGTTPVLSIVHVNASYAGATKNGSVRDPYNTITQAVPRVATGGKIIVAPGTYTGNLTINKQGIRLLSTDGAAVTHIQSSSVIGQNTISLVSGINNVIIGAPNKGFTITGFDGTGASETAAIYLLGSHTNIRIEGNEIVANGEHGIGSNFNTAIDNIIINQNIFSGKTFAGAEPGGCGSSTQFVAGNNVPRQLVVLGGSNTVTNSKNVIFTNNNIVGVTGGYNSASGCYQGNTQVTIDVIGATISGNIFNGVTTTGSSLRTRGNATSISCNTFYNTNLGERATHIFFFDQDPLTGAFPNSIQGVLESNSFPGGASGFAFGNITGNSGTYFIYRDATQADAVNAALGNTLTPINGASALATIEAYGDYSVVNDLGTCGATVNLPTPFINNNCGNVVSVTKDFAGSFFPVGTTKVIWTLTDVNGNTDTASQYVTVIDNQNPTIETVSNTNVCANASGLYQIPALVASDNCGIASIEYVISGATSRTGTGLDASGAFNIGTSTITYTIIDVNGNLKTTSFNVVVNAAATASFTTSTPDAFCNKLTLTANAVTGANYNWKFGANTVSTQQVLNLGLTNPDGVYTLTISDAAGCTSSAATYTYNKQSIAGNYTLLVSDDIKLGYGNQVASGSVGVMSNFGKAIFEQNSSVVGAGAFVKSPVVVRNGSGINLASVINGKVTVTLPVMKLNLLSTRNLRDYTVNRNTTANLSSNYDELTVREGANVTLSGNNYGQIRVEAGARILFTSSVVHIGSLLVEKGISSLNSMVRFSTDAEVRVSGTVSIQSNTRINPDQRNVTFYMGDGNKDDERFSVTGSNVQFTGNVYLPNGLIRLSPEGSGKWGKSSNTASNVFMTGFFIAEDIESNISNVIWNSYACGNAPIVVSNGYTSSQFQTEENTNTIEAFSVTVLPNPSTTYFTLKLQSKNLTPVQLRVTDATGRMVESKVNNASNSTVQIGHLYQPGVYYAELIQGTSRKVVQLLKVR